jgi:hypothetical protein
MKFYTSCNPIRKFLTFLMREMLDKYFSSKKKQRIN